jgi:hypothetical protein
MRFSLAIVIAAGCAAAPPPPVEPDHYRDPTAWLCLPGRANDPCSRDLATTEIRPDGTRAAKAPTEPLPIDCFYVYPTVDLRLRAANHTDFSDVGSITTTTRAQVARFSSVCSIYAPLYRQVTIGSYVRGGERLDDGLAAAYADVAAAFRAYLAHFDRGRRIVLIGHSQGAEMVSRLVDEFFDRDPAMRARLVVAMPIGGKVEVASGRDVGGTFANIPLCRALGQTGCVVAFRSYRDDGTFAHLDAEPAGRELACVNPGSLADPARQAPLDAAYPTGNVAGVDGVTTPYVSFPALYAGRCAEAPGGNRVLAITEISSARTSPTDLSKLRFSTKLGTHIIDLQIAQDDLIEIVQRAAQAAR